MEIFKKLLKKQSQAGGLHVCPSPYQVCYGKTVEALPLFHLKKWDADIVSACTGPNAGVTQLDLDAESIDARQDIAGVRKWNVPNDFTHGVSVSLYEEDRSQLKAAISDVTERKVMRVGEPIADVYGAVVRKNNAILAIADGSSWGKKPRLAARCAVRTAIEYISDNIRNINKNPSSKTLLGLLMEAMSQCHKCIMRNKATLTTLSIAVVCQLEDMATCSNNASWVVFTATLGDSRVFIYSPCHQNFIETSIGSHPVDGERVVSNSGGALGPAIGSMPDMENLAFSCIPVSAGDIVVLMTDGISDNFQPEMIRSNLVKNHQEVNQSNDSSPVLTVAEPSAHLTPHSHQSGDNVVTHACCQISCELQSAIRNHHESLQGYMSAQTISSHLVNVVIELTEEKRQFLAECIEKGIDRDAQFAEKKRQKTGKLDHATVLSYKIGQYAHPQ